MVNMESSIESKIIKFDENTIKTATKVLQRGGVIAFPTETLYALGCDGENEAGIEKIFRLKGRAKQKPLMAMLDSIEKIEKIAILTPLARIILKQFEAGGVSIILNKSKNCPQEINKGNDTVGVRIPKHQKTLQLLGNYKNIICTTSANQTGEPSGTTAKQVVNSFKKTNKANRQKIDLIIEAGSPRFKIQSTIIDFSNDKCSLLREGAVSIDAIELAIGRKLEIQILRNTKYA